MLLWLSLPASQVFAIQIQNHLLLFKRHVPHSLKGLTAAQTPCITLPALLTGEGPPETLQFVGQTTAGKC